MPAGSDVRRDLGQIFAAALDAVDPTRLVAGFLRGRPPGRRPLILGAGKAAARMAAGVEAAWPAARLRGLVIVPDGCDVPLRQIEIAVAGHPIPDARGQAATAALLRALRDGDGDPTLVLVSGGASSLLVQPRPPLTLAEKMAVTRHLLACGADITAINTVRKHLSTVKGGGLLRLAGGRPLLTLVLSDVVGDDPSVIGSGPTLPDPTTFADAAAVLERYDLRDAVPAAWELLERGRRGDGEETPKPGGPADAAETVVVGSNRTAVAAAAAAAARLGYTPVVAAAPLVGDSRDAAQAWIGPLAARATSTPWCAVAGGETTVTVRGHGRGGRNQEFALALVRPLAARSITVLSAGTDGIDGPTDAAGAFVDGATLARAVAAGLDPAAALADNDSYTFFERLGDLMRCGPTGTNVMDLKLAIGAPSSR
ncbi:MAG: glycerate kinase type-2 family protein [Candidatus Binatia bacterium]